MGALATRAAPAIVPELLLLNGTQVSHKVFLKDLSSTITDIKNK
jgi:hypothetical protein